MEKTIKIDKETSLRLSNNIGWLMEYQSQFDKDVLETLEPAAMAVVGLYSSINEVAREQNVSAADVIRTLDPDLLRDAVIDLSGLGAVDVINIIWSMAKAADDDIEEPRIWARQFETFPLDKILPEVVNMVLSGLITTKKLKGLQEMTRALEPSPSIES